MNKLTIPLVGQNFRPPARQVLTVLPLGTELHLRTEPENEYDPNAVRVEVDMGDFKVTKLPLLIAALRDTSFDASELCAKGMLMLGYLAASGKPTARGGPGNVQAIDMASKNDWGFIGLQATLTALADGSPAVVIEEKINAEDQART